MKKTLALAVALFFAFNLTTYAAENDIVDIAVDNGNFTVLVAALQQAELDGALKGEGPFTVFAPTDEAFTNLLSALGIEAGDLLGHPQLSEVLLYHVVSGKIMSGDLSDGITATTLKGDDISEISTTYTNRDAISSIRQTIHEIRIIDAARKRLKSNWNGTSTNIHFDKQAAFAKKLRIIDDNQELPPLGSIEMVLSFESEHQFEEFVNWFTPPTKDGRIINH